jgi:tetratricopeptide (TPR) repeat protein
MSNPNASPESIRQELQRVLDSEVFRSSPILGKFLQFVVQESLAGNDNQLKEYTIGKQVLGKNGNYDPRQDASVRIHAVRLRRLLKEYYQGEGITAPLQIAVPKGTYRPAFLNAPQGGKEREGKQGALSGASTGDTPEDVIRILPFSAPGQSMPSTTDPHAFCELLSSKLSLFQDITVVPYHRTQECLLQGGPVQQVATQLGATYYITGSFHYEEGVFHVSCQMFDASSHALLCSQDFTETTHGQQGSALTEKIVDQIVSALAGYSGYIHYRKFLANTRQEPLSNSMANAIYWFYRYYVQHSEDVFQEAIRQLEQASREDPSCSLGWGILAHLYADGVFYHYTTVPDPVQKAQEYLHKAFALNPHSQEAYLTQAWVHVLNRQPNDALACLEKVLAINPYSVHYISQVSLGMAMLGEYDRSIKLWERAIQMQKLPYWWLNIPKHFVALRNGDYSQALYYARRPGTPKMIYEGVLEMIALFLMKEDDQLGLLARNYSQRFPGQFAFVCQALPCIIFDEKLHALVADALNQIRALHFADEKAS